MHKSSSVAQKKSNLPVVKLAEITRPASLSSQNPGKKPVVSSSFLRNTLSQISPLVDMSRIQTEIKMYQSHIQEEQDHTSFDKEHGIGAFKSSKLPAITDLMTKGMKDMDRDVEGAIIEIVKYAQSLETSCRNYEKEIQRLDYLNKYFIIAQQKREDMLAHIIEENRQLKELNIVYERILQEKKREMMKITAKGSQQGVPLERLGDNTTKFMASPRSGGPSPIRAQTSSFMQTLEELKAKKQQVFKGNDLGTLGSQNIMNQRRVNTKLIDDKKSQSMLKMSEADAQNMYNENQCLLYFDQLMKDEDFFIQRMTTSDSSALIALFDNVQNIRTDHKSLFTLILRLKRIIKAANTLTASLALNEALEKIVDETCAVLDCDRASVFMVDHVKEELWTKVAKGSDVAIRIPINRGIVGYVATKGESLNILDAYQDSRFNKEVDLRTNYKTNTILCVPIVEDTGRIIGVIQAINKFGGVFTKDDEGLLNILASLAAIILRNSMNYDEQNNFHKYLRLALKTGIYLNSFFGWEKLLPNAEKKLKSVMSVEQGKIFIVYTNTKDNTTSLLRYNEKGEKEFYPIDCGIAGHAIRKKKLKSIGNAYNHHRYNGKIDIETSMPIITMPIFHPVNVDEVLGVLQVINAKGVIGVATMKKPKISQTDFETLDFFGKQLGQSIVNNFEWEKIGALKPQVAAIDDK